MSKSIPRDRFYSSEHEWLKIANDGALMGISDHAQSCLGDVVYVELPEKGRHIKKGEAIGVVESVKAVSDIFAPVSGKVLDINQSVIDNPELINNDPYSEGWLIKILISDKAETSSLLAPEKYEDLLLKEAKF